MGLTPVEYQAVKMYSPSETKFNEKTSECEWHLPYFNLVTCDDVSEILFDTSVISSNLSNDPTMAYELSGTNTSVTAFKLNDVSEDFLINGVVVGMYIKNLATNTFAKITEIVSDKQLTIDTNIFTSSPTNYEISYYQTLGNLTQGTGQLIKTSGGTGSFVQRDIFEVGQMYKITIDITEFTYTTVGDSIYFKIGSDTFLIVDGVSEEAAGTKTFYAIANDTYFEANFDAGVTARAANFQVVRVSNPVLFVINCETDEIVYISSLNDYDISNGQIKISFDWGYLSDGYNCSGGCYYFGILEDVGIPTNITNERVNDGTFDGAGWLYGTDWANTGTAAAITSTGGAGYLTQNSLLNDFSEGISYDITFEINSYINGNITVVLANSISDFIILETFSGNATHVSRTGVLSKNYSQLVFIPNNGNANFQIDNVSALASFDGIEFDFSTDCFSIAESHDCTVKLSGTNLDDAFGVNFSTNYYTPFVRVQGQLRTPTYEDDIEDEEDSLGSSKLIYFNSDKIYMLHLYQLPEYLHDFIRLLRGYDTFLIDGNQYLAKGGYKPEWVIQSNKVLDLANVDFNVKQKIELNKNKYC